MLWNTTSRTDAGTKARTRCGKFALSTTTKPMKAFILTEWDVVVVLIVEFIILCNYGQKTSSVVNKKLARDEFDIRCDETHDE